MNINECKIETLKHINTVDLILKNFSSQLIKRGEEHDKSKLESPEVETFAEYTPKLALSTYGGEEYNSFLKGMNVALKHHYGENRHHPEHFANGIKDMNLIDIIELIADWKSATLRHDNGDLIKSIELNQKRFGYTDEIKNIFLNTARILYKYEISYGCCDGREEVFLGDTKELITEKIDKSLLLSDYEKRLLITGYDNQFKDKDYENDYICIDNCFGINWKVNNYK